MCKQNAMAHIQHFVWDFDGTLFDTYPTIIDDLRNALAEFGHDLDPVETMKLMLINIPTARDFYADKYGIDREALDAAYQRHHKRTVEIMLAPPMEGIREVLQKICDTGRHNYIFTHRKVGETQDYLAKYGLTEYFRDLIGPESPCFAWKPAPDAVLYLMETYGMTKDNVVMVGDRDCDLGSARNADIGTVHFVCAVAPEDLDCSWRVESFAQMLEML